MQLTMPERINASDVLDANARIKRSFSATIVGFFKNTGANPWDDYEFVRVESGTVETYPGTSIQLEEHGTRLRMLKDGRVIRVKWSPSNDDPESVRDGGPGEQRRYFIEAYLEAYDEAPGLGAAAVIASKLT
jgi:hypothetical protein